MDILTPEGRFQYCVKIILEHEGALEDNKRDPGGVTNWGISLRFIRVLGLDINHDGTINQADILGLSQPAAIEIYRKYWWDKYHYNAFNDIQIACKVFDLSVNMGPMTSHKLLQIAINRLNVKPIAVDGIIGGNTIAAANELNGDELHQQLRDCAQHHYIQLIADNHNLSCFKNGWMNRAAW